MKFLKVLVDDKHFFISKNIIKKNFPDSYFSEVLKIYESNEKINHNQSSLRLDMDIDSVSTIISFIRGYEIPYNNIYLLKKIYKDSKTLKIFVLENIIDNILIKNKITINNETSSINTDNVFSEEVSDHETLSSLVEQFSEDINDITNQNIILNDNSNDNIKSSIDEILDKITEDTVSSKIKNKYINIEKN